MVDYDIDKALLFCERESERERKRIMETRLLQM